LRVSSSDQIKSELPDGDADPRRLAARACGELRGLRHIVAEGDALMFNRILVPTDFNAPSDAALEYAKVLAGQFGASLHVQHVVGELFATAPTDRRCTLPIRVIW
jgi:hypothetical protein